MKKVLFITNSSSLSGAEKVTLKISSKLSKDYQFVYVLIGTGNMQKILTDRNIEYITLKKLSLKNFSNVIKKEKPDIIHAHDFRASFLASFFNKKAVVISHIHQNPNWLHKFSLNSLIFLFSSLKAKNVLIVSDSIKDEYIFSKYIDKKIINISNPVSCDDIYNKVDIIKKIDEREYDICYVGRLVPVKRVDMLIDIIFQLKKQYPKIRCMIVGDGYLFYDLKNKVNDLNLSRNITFCGFQTNPYQYLNNSKIFCLPSEWEGFGLVAFEALALGLPVVASRVGGLKEIVNSNCGYLCSSIKEFVDSISSLLSDVTLLEDKSVASYKRAKELDNIDVYIENINMIYKQVK